MEPFNCVTPGLHTGFMAEQLVLLPDRTTPNWKIDDQTKQIGRDGVARARAILSGMPHGDTTTSTRRSDHAA